MASWTDSPVGQAPNGRWIWTRPRGVLADVVCAAHPWALNIIDVDLSGFAPWICPRSLRAQEQRVLVEQRGELLRSEDAVALGHKLTDLLPFGVVGEQHRDAITAGSRGEERVPNGQQHLTFVWVGAQHE